MSDDIKWNRKRHDENLTELQKQQEELADNKVRAKVNLMYQDWKSRVKHGIKKKKIRSAADVQATIDQLKLNVMSVVGDNPRLQTWVDATVKMLEEASLRCAAGLLRSGGEDPTLDSGAGGER